MSSLSITLEFKSEDIQTIIKKGPISIQTPVNNPNKNLISTILKLVNNLAILSNTLQNKNCTLPMLTLDEHIVVDQSKLIVNTKPNSLYSNFISNDTTWTITQISNVQGIALKSPLNTIALHNQILNDYEPISN